MEVYIGSDHGGFTKKQEILNYLQKQSYKVTDCGTYNAEKTDYPDFAAAVGQAVAGKKETFGILLCRSGEGMEMAANKIAKIRAALVWEVKVAFETRQDNDANILVLPSDFISSSLALDIVQTFLTTPFSGEERHIRRLEKLHTIEHTRYES